MSARAGRDCLLLGKNWAQMFRDGLRRSAWSILPKQKSERRSRERRGRNAVLPNAAE
jgi:hypothetical protein